MYMDIDIFYPDANFPPIVIDVIILYRTVNTFLVMKGSEFSTSVNKLETDLTPEMLARLVPCYTCIR